MVCNATSVLKQFSNIDDSVAGSPFCVCVFVCVCVCARMCLHACSVTQSCLTLGKPMDCSLPGSSGHGIFQARILERVAISYSRGSSQPRGQTRVSCISCTVRQDNVPPIPTVPPEKSFILFHGLIFLFVSNQLSLFKL